MDPMLHLHFYWNENNNILPELSEIKSEPLSMHSLWTLHCTPYRNFSHSARETIETHSISLRLQTSNMKSYIQHSISSKCIIERIKNYEHTIQHIYIENIITP
jgi:hypothetical protein